MTPAPKKFYLSRDDKIIAGVCGGIAEYFSIDSFLIRFITVAAVIFSHGFVFLLYLIIAVVAEPPPPGIHQGETQHPGHVAPPQQDAGFDFWTAVAIILIIFGALSLLGEFFPMSWLGWDVIWPILLIGFGVAIVTRKR